MKAAATLTRALAAGTLAGVVALAGCACPPTQEDPSATGTSERTASANAVEPDESASGKDNIAYVPLHWDVNEAHLVVRQGSAGLWGTCGQCCIANTLNLVTGSDFTETDIVDYALERSLCIAETGGMTLDEMVDAYSGLLPLERMDVRGYGGGYAPTVDELAVRLEHGIILNVSVYGEMMREGGHTGEGEIDGTHWIVLHSVERDADGDVAGFGIIDSASGATWLDVQELSDIYYGHDGTVVTDPACVQVFGWRQSG